MYQWTQFRRSPSITHNAPKANKKESAKDILISGDGFFRHGV